MTEYEERPDTPSGTGTTVPLPGHGEHRSTREKHMPYRENLRTFLFLTILLLVFLATLQLYFTLQGLVNTWFADDVVPIINAGFFLVVIAGGLYVIRTYILHQKEA